MRTLVADLNDAKVSWRTLLLTFGAFILPISLFYFATREMIAPEIIDQSVRNDVGDVGAWILLAIFVLMAIVVLFALLLGLQWVALRVIEPNASLHAVAVAVVASELPQIPIMIASIVVFAVAHASGVDVRSESTFGMSESVITSAIWIFYLVLAISAAAKISVAKATLAVAMGPGLLIAAMLWFSLSAG